IRRPHREINACGIADCAQMGAKFVVYLPVLAFGEQMQIYLPHDWPVLIWIPREVLRSVQACDTDVIWEVAGRARHCRAKESVLLNSLRCNRLLCFSIQHDIDRARVRAKDTNLQIIANAVRTQHAEWISMITGNKAAHLITRESTYIKSFH